MTELSRADFEQRLIALAAENAEIRSQLVSDPKAVIANMLGSELPAEINIVIHEEDADTLHFVLPPANDELNAAELAAVAGGVCWDDCGPQYEGSH